MTTSSVNLKLTWLKQWLFAFVTQMLTKCAIDFENLNRQKVWNMQCGLFSKYNTSQKKLQHLQLYGLLPNELWSYMAPKSITYKQILMYADQFLSKFTNWSNIYMFWTRFNSIWTLHPIELYSFPLTPLTH